MFVVDENLVYDLAISNVATHRDAVIVELVASIGPDDIQVSGCARRHPEDKPNSQIGVDLALARALESLVAKLRRRANGAVKHAEDVELQKLRQQQPNPFNCGPECAACAEELAGEFGVEDYGGDFFESLFGPKSTPLGRVLNRDTKVYEKVYDSKPRVPYYKDEPWR